MIGTGEGVMSMSESNICEQCGGYTSIRDGNITYQFRPVPPGSTLHLNGNVFTLCPGHPAPVPAPDRGMEAAFEYHRVMTQLQRNPGIDLEELAHIRTNIEKMASDTEPTPKHDGTLDEEGNATVKIDEYPQVFIANRYTEAICLTPKQALSLLAWLKQEEATLETLVKEQDG